MLIKLREIREMIRGSLGGSEPSEAYDKLTIDDDAFNEPSVYVSDDVKDQIRTWYATMMPDTRRIHKKKRAR